MTWQRVRLQDLGDWYGGGTPSKSRPDYWTDGSIPWLSPKDMGPEVLHSTEDAVTAAAVSGSSVRLVPSNAVAVVVRSGILERKLPVALVPFETTLNQDMKAVAPRPGIDSRWIAWGLRAFERGLLRKARKTGTTVASIEMPRFYDFELPVPPLDEQRRIVDLLEDHLSRLDAADLQLATGLHRVDSLRVASMRRALCAQPDWKVAPIDDWLDFSIGGLWGNPPGTDEIDVRVVRVTEMKAWGRIAPGTAAVRSITARQLAGRALEEGDLLLEKSGGGPKTPVGRVGLIESLPEPSICANFMQLMRPDRSRVNPRFLHYALNAFHLSGGTAPMQTASTNIRNIKASEYLRVAVALPSLEQQDRLATQVRAEQDAADRLARAVVNMQARNAELRRSLLAAAFSGRLSAGRLDLERD